MARIISSVLPPSGRDLPAGLMNASQEASDQRFRDFLASYKSLEQPVQPHEKQVETRPDPQHSESVDHAGKLAAKSMPRASPEPPVSKGRSAAPDVAEAHIGMRHISPPSPSVTSKPSASVPSSRALDSQPRPDSPLPGKSETKRTDVAGRPDAPHMAQERAVESQSSPAAQTVSGRSDPSIAHTPEPSSQAGTATEPRGEMPDTGQSAVSTSPDAVPEAAASSVSEHEDHSAVSAPMPDIKTVASPAPEPVENAPEARVDESEETGEVEDRAPIERPEEDITGALEERPSEDVDVSHDAASAKTHLDIDLGASGRVHVELCGHGEARHLLKIEADNQDTLDRIRNDSADLLSSLQRVSLLQLTELPQVSPPYDILFGFRPPPGVERSSVTQRQSLQDAPSGTAAPRKTAGTLPGVIDLTV